MKRIAIVLLTLTAIGCQKETDFLEVKNTEVSSMNKTVDGFSPIQTELVIYYEDGTTEEKKIELREESGVIEYKQCKCADENLELWIFEPPTSSSNGGNIEEKAASAKAKEDIENADYSFKMDVSFGSFIAADLVGDVNDGIAQTVGSNDGVTIAVLDTGVSYDYDGFTEPFLYNVGSNSCADNGYEELFGWDFVNNSNNPFDDYFGKHGTAVTSFISNRLTQEEVPHQILPVKVADSEGGISYFDLLCGFRYAVGKPDVDIINMSFGWYDQELTLLREFIEEAPEVLVVTSSGNNSADNDLNPHYPSSFLSSNVLCSAALNEEFGASNMFQIGPSVTLARYSNYGLSSVDVAARGTEIPFLYKGETFLMTGTSFSAAITSAFAGKLHSEANTGEELKSQVFSFCVPHNNLFMLSQTSYVPLY